MEETMTSLIKINAQGFEKSTWAETEAVIDDQKKREVEASIAALGALRAAAIMYVIAWSAGHVRGPVIEAFQEIARTEILDMLAANNAEHNPDNPGAQD
jgi:hypothetical protein